METGDEAVGRRALAKASWRLLPLIGLGYGVSYMDRANISFASLQMNHDLGFTATVYGLGGGLFFLSYAALEAPSNLMLVRFGARRWIARIMVTWGVLAAAMLFVRTPLQFYAMRFALGAAEAGFFPGVIYYLMRWFPARERGRAISRFYIAAPLSAVVMGLIAGALLGLDGTFGLKGWQWLFLVEGLPAVALGAVVLAVLPETPADARWLSAEERTWIEAAIARDQAAPGAADTGALGALKDPRVWLLGLVSALMLGSNYAINLSAPAILQAATGLSAGKVGLLTAAVNAVAALAMLAAGWSSDRTGERRGHAAAFMAVIAAGFLATGLSAAGAVTVGAYAVYVVGASAIQAVIWLMPTDVLRGRSAAVGVAAIGSIGMVGAFVGPWAWGLARDATGDYRAGLLSLAVPFLAGAALVLAVRAPRRTLTTIGDIPGSA